MALSDCIKCWNTPCTCGYNYRKWGKDIRIEQAAVILGISDAQLSYLIAKYVPRDHPMRDEE